MILLQVGSDFKQNRFWTRLAPVDGLEEFQYFFKWLLILQRTQSRCIGRAQIDRKIIDVVEQLFKTPAVIACGHVEWRISVLPDITAYDNILRPMGKAFTSLIRSSVIKAHPVDQGPVGRQPE